MTTKTRDMLRSSVLETLLKTFPGSQIVKGGMAFVSDQIDSLAMLESRIFVATQGCNLVINQWRHIKLIALVKVYTEPDGFFQCIFIIYFFDFY